MEVVSRNIPSSVSTVTAELCRQTVITRPTKDDVERRLEALTTQLTRPETKMATPVSAGIIVDSAARPKAEIAITGT